MLSRLLFCLALTFVAALPARAAYSGVELQEDCLAAEAALTGQDSRDVFHSVKSSRCLNYLEGFLDGYRIADDLAASVGVRLEVFCPPRAPEDRIRLVRAVLAYLDRQPPLPRDGSVPADKIVAAALGVQFVCPVKK